MHNWIVGGYCDNIISQSFVDRLKVKLRRNDRPYFVLWLKTSDKVQVRHACQVTFAIGKDYKDTFWCDVLPMDIGDILLRRPWMYNKNGTHGMRDNTYMFVHNGDPVTLHPKKLELAKKGSRTSVTREALQINHVYRGKVKKTCLRSNFFSTLGE